MKLKESSKMLNYKEELNRQLQLLFPPSMDEFVDEKITEYLSSLEYSDTCDNKEMFPVIMKQNLNRLKKYKLKLCRNLYLLKENNSI